MFTQEELENLKMALVHSTVGWVKPQDGKDEIPEPWMGTLLKKVDFSLDEDGVFDPDYKYGRMNFNVG